MYKHPGVYIEHFPSGLLAIEAGSTSIAAFIGPVKRGPVGEPVFIFNVNQFAQQFGTLNDGARGIRHEGQNANYLAPELKAEHLRHSTYERRAENLYPIDLTGRF